MGLFACEERGDTKPGAGVSRYVPGPGGFGRVGKRVRHLSTAGRGWFMLSLMTSRVAIGLLFVLASLLSPRHSGADDDHDRALRQQIEAPSREEIVVDNALAAALADFYEIVPMRLDSAYVKKVTERRQKKFDDVDQGLLCASRGNIFGNTAAATQRQCLVLARLWAKTYYPALQQLGSAYVRGRADALVSP
jgi:hypothetical protein